MISLLYSGNDKVFKGLLISLVSIAENTAEPLDVHVLTMDLSDIKSNYLPINREQTDFIEKLLKEQNPESSITLHDLTEKFKNEMLDSPNIENFYTPYAFLRLFADEAELPARIIYLDTDTVARGDIAPLFSYELDGAEFAGARDYLGKFFISPNYINSGVMLLDMEKIRETGFFKKARRFCATKKTSFPDQDAINHYAKKKRFFPSRFNEQRSLKKDTVIRHFSKTLRLFPYFHTINVKPWDIEGLHKKHKTFDFDDVIYRCLSYIDEFEKQNSEE
ncbi:MAG: hypothetical protein J6C89_06165 [Clostridia bacterium]|nr:hypothetical protein [Clostridia bacterium]